MPKQNDPVPGAPSLLPQPAEGDDITAPELINRYGTYNIQPTGASGNFFPAIAAGIYDSDRLHRLRQQTVTDTRACADPEHKKG